jgi:hypothetical protein
MKIVQKTSIRFLLISAVFFCYGLSTYPNDFPSPYCIEFSEGNNSNKNSVISDIEPFSGDQIPQAESYGLFADRILSAVTLQDAFLITNPYLRIWQPPKI